MACSYIQLRMMKVKYKIILKLEERAFEDISFWSGISNDFIIGGISSEKTKRKKWIVKWEKIKNERGEKDNIQESFLQRSCFTCKSPDSAEDILMLVGIPSAGKSVLFWNVFSGFPHHFCESHEYLPIVNLLYGQVTLKLQYPIELPRSNCNLGIYVTKIN